jgi:hypothetical protein
VLLSAVEPARHRVVDLDQVCERRIDLRVPGRGLGQIERRRLPVLVLGPERRDARVDLGVAVPLGVEVHQAALLGVDQVGGLVGLDQRVDVARQAAGLAEVAHRNDAVVVHRAALGVDGAEVADRERALQRREGEQDSGQAEQLGPDGN